MIIPGGRIEDFHGMQILSLVYGPDRILGIAIKRLLDIVIATAALIVFSPLLLILAAADLAAGRAADPLPPGAGRPPRAPVPRRQVPDDGPRRRGPADRARGGRTRSRATPSR